MATGVMFLLMPRGGLRRKRNVICPVNLPFKTEGCLVDPCHFLLRRCCFLPKIVVGLRRWWFVILNLVDQCLLMANLVSIILEIWAIFWTQNTNLLPDVCCYCDLRSRVTSGNNLLCVLFQTPWPGWPFGDQREAFQQLTGFSGADLG